MSVWEGLLFAAGSEPIYSSILGLGESKASTMTILFLVRGRHLENRGPFGPERKQPAAKMVLFGLFQNKKNRIWPPFLVGKKTGASREGSREYLRAKRIVGVCGFIPETFLDVYASFFLLHVSLRRVHSRSLTEQAPQ